MSLQSDVIVVDPTVGELMVSVAAVYSVPVRSIVLVRIDSAAATATQGCPPQSRLGGVPDAEAGGALPRRRDLRKARQREAAQRISFSRVSSSSLDLRLPPSHRTRIDKDCITPKRTMQGYYTIEQVWHPDTAQRAGDGRRPVTPATITPPRKCGTRLWPRLPRSGIRRRPSPFGQ